MKVLFSNPIWKNPLPQLRSRNSCFPYLCELADGLVLATHQIGEAFESVDGTVHISCSADKGRTWGEPWPLGSKDLPFPTSDSARITRLSDGRLLAFGYSIIRDNPDLPISNPENGGFLDSAMFFCLSEDNGKTWSRRREISCAWGRHVEAPAAITVLKDGSWVSPITGFPNWDGEATGKPCGRLLRSDDQGKTWNDDTVCMEFAGRSVTYYEQKLCQLDDGTIIVIAWNEDMSTGETLNNHYTVSYDNGHSFSEPLDTGIGGQTPFICHISASRMFALHTMRRNTDKPGIYGCIVDFSDNKWDIVDEALLWSPAEKLVASENTAKIFAYLKFGYPSAVVLKDGTVLMSHWVAEDGQYFTVSTGIAL